MCIRDSSHSEDHGHKNPEFAKYWMHNGFINVDNEKMSKSLGNFFTIRDVLKLYDPETVRFFVARSHYRSPLNYSNVHLDDAKGALRRLYTALSLVDHDDLNSVSDVSEGVGSKIDWSNPYAARFKAAMDEDFATPEAVSVLFDLAGELNKTKDLALAHLMRQLGKILGLLQRDPTEFLQSDAGSNEGGMSGEEIQTQIEARAQAKKNKDFALADKIRADLLSQGIVLKDSPQGTQWERV